MVRAIVFALAVAGASCASAPVAQPPRARIAQDIALTLPLPPGYPDTRTIVQTGRAQYGERQAAFEAVLSLAPERVEIVLTIPGGPRVATVTWDEAGVREVRSQFAPDDVPVENILGDIFLTIWPVEAVRASLPDGVKLTVDTEGRRTVRLDDEIIVTVTPDPEDRARVVVRNARLGYEVVIVSQNLE